jgi:YVTN family beta-propeller protein
MYLHRTSLHHNGGHSSDLGALSAKDSSGVAARRAVIDLRRLSAPVAVCAAILTWSSVSLAATPAGHPTSILVPPTVAVGNEPNSLAFDTQTHTLYTVNQGGSVSVIDTRQCDAQVLKGCHTQRVGTVALPSGSAPQGIGINTVTDTVYVADTSKYEISVINGATCNAANRSGCGQTPALLADPSGPAPIAVDSATDTVYAGNPILGGNDTVSVFNGATCNGAVRSGCGQTSTAVHVGLEPWDVEIDPGTNTVYAVNQGFSGVGNPGDTVSVFGAATCDGVQSSGCGQVSTITVGAGPDWIAFDDPAHTAYVANATAGTVSVINTATCDATDTSGCGQKTTTVRVGINPFAMTIDQRLHSLYVANNEDDTVSVINTTTCDATTTSSCSDLPPTVQVGMGPQALLTDPNTGTVYSANFLANTVSVLDATTCDASTTSGCRTVAQAAPVGAEPTDVAVDTANNSVYVTNQGRGTVSVLDARTCDTMNNAGCRNPAATIHVGTSPAGVAVDQATGTVYVANNGGNTVSVIDAAICNATDHAGCAQPPGTIAVGSSPFAIAVNQVTDSVYVTELGTNDEGDTVAVINGASCNATTHAGCGQAPATITVGEGPFAIAVNATTNTVYVADTGQLFESNSGGDTVSVINGASCDGTVTSGCGQAQAKVTVGSYPFGIAVDAATNRIFVANNDTGDGPASLSVISGSTCEAADTSGCGTAPPTLPGVGRAPNGIAFDPSTGAVYTANYQDASVSVVGVDHLRSSIVPPRLAVGSLPSAVAVDPANNTIYVTSEQDGTVSVLSDRTPAHGR